VASEIAEAAGYFLKVLEERNSCFLARRFLAGRFLAGSGPATSTNQFNGLAGAPESRAGMGSFPSRLELPLSFSLWLHQS